MDMSFPPRFGNFTRPKGQLRLKNPEDFYAYWIPASMHGFSSLTGMYHGTPTSTGVTFGNGERGSFASLNGATSTRIDCGAINVAGLTEFTITAVLYMDGSGTDEHTIISNWENGVNSGMFLLRVDPSLSNQIEFHVCREANTEISVVMSDIALTTNKTHILTCRFNSIDGTGLTGFRDDIKSGSSTATSSALDATTTISNTYIGNSPHNSADGLTGGIYAVMFRKRAISDAEVFALHRNWWSDLEYVYPRNRVGTTSGQNITVSAISSVEAFGTPSLNQNISVSAISSAEVFGTTNLNLNISPSAISSDEAHGTQKVNLNVNPSSVASVEAFGTSQLNLFINATAIASLEAFGSHTVSFPGAINIECTGIASAEAFGNAKINLNITPSTVSSGELFGNAQLNNTVFVTAVSSAEVFGTAQLNMFVTATAIASAEVFGNPLLGLSVLALSITSQEAFSNPILNQVITASGITSGEQFGLLVLTGGATALGYLEATIKAYPSLDASIIAFSSVDANTLTYPSIDGSVEVKH